MTQAEIMQRIQALPAGGLTKKKINGREYTYYQWTENKKQRSRSVSAQEAQELAAQIAERKALQAQLKAMPATDLYTIRHYGRESLLLSQPTFATDVRIGASLDAFAATTSSYRPRKLYGALHSFVHDESHDKVCILYGLRRTGKTTLIRQVIYSMTPAMRSKAVFIQSKATNTLADVNRDLRQLESLGYRYVFIDEATLMDDFIEGAALFSDVYAASGMKIVLSGTDSLGFIFSQDEQLYDRCLLLHTTFIPFREFSAVLGIGDIDEFIRYGGTMSKSGENYNKAIFASAQSTDEYVNTAIARNIQHSL